MSKAEFAAALDLVLEIAGIEEDDRDDARAAAHAPGPGDTVAGEGERS